MIDISDIRIRMIDKDDSNLKAVASFIIDNCFVVHDIKIIEGNQGLFISMPSRKTPNGTFKDVVHPLDSETRQKMSELIFAEYEKAKLEQPAAPAEEAAAE